MSEYGEWWHYTARSRSVSRRRRSVPGTSRPLVRERAERSGFLYGLAPRPAPEELGAHDRLYEVIVGVSAVKRAG